MTVDIKEQAKAVEAAGLKWTEALSRFTVARDMVADDRNERAGDVFNARKAFEAELRRLVDMCDSAQPGLDLG
jgi:hypothetical protein